MALIWQKVTQFNFLCRMYASLFIQELATIVHLSIIRLYNLTISLRGLYQSVTQGVLSSITSVILFLLLSLTLSMRFVSCLWVIWRSFLFSALEVVCESVSAVGSFLVCFCQAAAKLHQIASRPWQFHSSQLTCRLYEIVHKILGKGKKSGFVKEKKNPRYTFTVTKSHGATQKTIQNTL